MFDRKRGGLAMLIFACLTMALHCFEVALSREVISNMFMCNRSFSKKQCASFSASVEAAMMKNMREFIHMHECM